MMLPLSRRVAVFLYCNISELNRATKEFFSVSLEVSLKKLERPSNPFPIHVRYDLTVTGRDHGLPTKRM